MRTTAMGLVMIPMLIVAGCHETVTDDRPAVQPPLASQPVARQPHVAASRPVSLGPKSEAQAVQIAREYMAREHADITLASEAPQAKYYVHYPPAIPDARPAWAVTFAAPAPKEPPAVRPYESFSVFLAQDGHVVTWGRHSP